MILAVVEGGWLIDKDRKLIQIQRCDDDGTKGKGCVFVMALFFLDGWELGSYIELTTEVAFIDTSRVLSFLVLFYISFGGAKSVYQCAFSSFECWCRCSCRGWSLDITEIMGMRRKVHNGKSEAASMI
ncbi:hypothetical protein VNO77_17339 [Canavalia gladiata]|uniref:Uncharacterized protein n=1 Tax=Canavalia gladiata TaxID=3824 RepID=A0AAN9LJI4_CANGL